MVVSCFDKWFYPTLLVKPQRLQLLLMFFLRGFLCMLLPALLILVSCNQSANEVHHQLKVKACRSNEANYSDSLDVHDARVGSKLVSGHFIEQYGLENICPFSNSFCFASTLSGSLANGSDAESVSWVQSEGFSSDTTLAEDELSWLPHQGIFRPLGGRSISCSFSLQDGLPVFTSIDRNTKSNLHTDVSSCINPLISERSHSSRLVGDNDTAKSGFLEGLSLPPVEVKPSLLDWGHKNIFQPSLAYLTLKNVHVDSVLSVYDIYSSNSQFYPCNASDVSLAPGEVALICFVFYPTHLGLSQAQLVLQTGFGGFLVQAKGEAVESPYLVKPLSGLDISSGGRWRKNLSLFNPYDEVLYVDEVTAWMSTSSGNISHSSKSSCRIEKFEASSDYKVLSAKDWFAVERKVLGRPLFAMRPHNWEVGPKKTETIMELDMSDHIEGKIVATFCLQLLRSSNNEADTVVIPLEAELGLNAASNTDHVSSSLEALVPCNASGPIAVALSIRNDAPHLLRFVKVTEVGDCVGTFQIKSVEGLVLFPNTTTQVAILTYANTKTQEVSMDCKLHVLIDGTESSRIEIPFIDVINICPRRQLDSSAGNTEGISNVDYINGGERIFRGSMQRSSGLKAVDAREADELVLRNWKYQATSSFLSVLNENELLFPVVLVGNYSSQLIAVRNPGPNPVAMQILLNSGEVVDNCQTSDVLMQHCSSNILAGEKSSAPTRYGFSIAKDALTESFIPPYGSTALGPVLFQPSSRCEWRSSVLVRNNLTGVEWLSLRGYGGSLSLVLLEDDDPVQSLEFKLNLPASLNFSSPDMLGKPASCDQSMTKEVYAKNNGDVPVQVMKVEVSGAECGLDGFTIHDCEDFSLQPGESARLRISYKTDFSVPTIYRDLELVLASGVVVIPMKAAIPICLISFCKRSLFWFRLKKTMLVILFVASLLVFLFFTHVPVFASQDVKDGKSSTSVARSLNSLFGRFSLKNTAVNGFPHKEALLLESASKFSKDAAPDGELGSPSARVKELSSQSNSLLDIEADISPVSTTLLVENFETQDSSDSRNLRVRIGKEKGRRRRKKKNSCVGALLFEVSSSHSGNSSTPSSPSSPGVSSVTLTPKRPPSMSPTIEHPVESRNPFSEAPARRSDKTKSPHISPVVDKRARSGFDNSIRGAASAENPNVSQKVTLRSVHSPPATVPAADTAVPPWAYRSAVELHARAPGSRVHAEKTGGIEENKGIEQKYTYDIWGDHLLTYSSNKVVSLSAAFENNSESFFVWGPQALVKHSMLQPGNSNEGNE